MARPASRGRRSARDRSSRDEEEDDRGRGRSSSRPPSGPPVAMILGGVGLLILIGVAVYAMAPSKKAPPPQAPPPAPAPKTAEAPKVVIPTRVLPKPLTESEKSYIGGLFARAQPHMDLFEKYAKQGWDLKEKGDNEGANDAWVKAKDEGHEAIRIVNEAMEDEDKFPLERPGMEIFNNRQASWTKKLMELPKVNTVR